MDEITAMPRIEAEPTPTRLGELLLDELPVTRFTDELRSFSVNGPLMVNHAQLLGREDD